jgi:hypothetical protein
MADSPKLTSKQTVWCVARVDRADGPQPTHRRSAIPWRIVRGSWRIVRPAQRATLTTVDFAFLPLEFKRGQSVRPSRAVREAIIFDITASNRKGSINTPCPGWESCSWHFERFILHCRALPVLSHSLCLVVASLARLRASSALHLGFDLCGTRESSSSWLLCYSWKLPLPRRLGGVRIR